MSSAHSALLIGGRRAYWALLPALAIIAYVTVLRIGFVSDDFMQVYGGRLSGINLPDLLPDKQNVGFYRPVGVLLIWQLGYFLWGYNPFPYHLVQLLVHAINSLMLGLWLSWLTRRQNAGWLAGALFAVFPLHSEAVGFVGAQFDTYSVLFALGSLWCFGVWWRSYEGRMGTKWAIYLSSLLLYSLAVFTKESVFLFMPVLAASAWVVASPSGWRGWRRLGYALAPFSLPVILNVMLRLSAWGTLGGYELRPITPQYFGIILRLMSAYWFHPSTRQ